MDYPATITAPNSSETKVNSIIIIISTNCFFWSIERVQNVRMPGLATSAVAPVQNVTRYRGRAAQLL